MKLSFYLKNSLIKNFSKIRYHKSHEWVKLVSDKKALIGITDYAKDQLGELVFADLNKEVGDKVDVDEEVSQLESVKASAPVFSPISGKVLRKNDNAKNDINVSAENNGWMYELEIENTKEYDSLLTKEEYQKLL